MDEMLLVRHLRDTAERFRVFAAITPTPEASNLADFHLRLADLIQERPLAHDFEFPDPDSLPVSLREAIKAANLAFRIQQPQKMRARLDTLIEITARAEGEKSGIAMILNLSARQWKKAIEDLRSPASLQLALSPSLDLDSRAQELRPIAENRLFTDLPLSIINTGLLPAYDVLLTISATGGVQDLSITPATLLKPGSWQLEIEQEVPPRKPITITLQVGQRLATSLKMTANFTHYAPKAMGGQSNTLTIDLPVAGELLPEARNPFRPDLPLTPLTDEGDWTPLMKGERELLATEILTDPLLDSGRIYVIRGVRRCGKTSLLRGLCEKMSSGGEKFLPVYIDISSWFLALQEKAASIDIGGLLYELADSAARKTMFFLSEEDVESARDIDDLLARSQGMTLDPGSFGLLLDKVTVTTGRRVVFLLDELDWWIRQAPFKGDAQTLLAHLAAFSANGNCGMVLAHDWTTRGWDVRYREDNKLLPIPKRIGFLSRDVFHSLVRSIPRQVTPVAAELLWRVTGGWPGLAQLICFELSEALRREDVVTEELSKKAIETILASKDWQPFLTSLMASFSEAEIAFLSWALSNRLIDPSTLAIRGLSYAPGHSFRLTLNDASLRLTEEDLNDALRTLIDKQVLELNERHEITLRVGAFSYSSLLELYTASGAVV
jgi:hypothetical protein